MKIRLRAYFIILLSVLLLGWGRTGHRKIGRDTALFLNAEMQQFMQWPEYLSQHGSDADYRKNDDPTEGPKHYIDIDNYPEFISDGRIPSTLDSLKMYYHPNFIDDQGYLPWATLAAFDSLRDCFLREEWDRAEFFAADLGHYVGDGHVPLHLTRNYDGQFSGNNGIHSRYESDMIGVYAAGMEIQGDSIRIIPDVNNYVFSYIYRNYSYVDSIMLADDYASALAGNTWSQEYTAALWEKTGNWTTELFRNASRSLTELIYTAWSEAGKPSMDPAGLMEDRDRKGILRQNFPNPFSTSTSIRFSLSGESRVRLMVLDMTGRQVEVLAEGDLGSGDYGIEWVPLGIQPGIYYLVLQAGDRTETRTMILQSPH